MTAELWPAPVASSPVDATVSVPGSKSITNRALVLAALADGPSRIEGALRSRDTDLMTDALRAMGADITTDGDVHQVVPAPLHGADVACGLAGTVLRFLPAGAALATGEVRFTADEAAQKRPMGTTLSSLTDLGATVTGSGRADTPLPFTVSGTGTVRGGEVRVDASALPSSCRACCLPAPGSTRASP